MDSYKLIVFVLLLLSVATFMNTKSVERQLVNIKTCSGYENCNKVLGVALEEKSNQIAVVDIMENTPAEHAGILEDDIIVAINGEKVRSIDDVKRSINSVEGGESINIEISRKNQKTNLVVTLNPKSVAKSRKI